MSGVKGKSGRKPTIGGAGRKALPSKANETLLEKYRRQALELEADIKQLRERGGGARDVAFMSSTLARTYEKMGKITGEGELSEATILKSPALGFIIGTVLEALKPFPAAAMAVRDALKKARGDAPPGDNS